MLSFLYKVLGITLPLVWNSRYVFKYNHRNTSGPVLLDSFFPNPFIDLCYEQKLCHFQNQSSSSSFSWLWDTIAVNFRTMWITRYPNLSPYLM